MKVQRVKRHPTKIRQAIIDNIAAGETTDETAAIIRRDFDYVVPVNTIAIIRVRHRETIMERRVQLTNEVNRIPVANVYYRMLQRQKMVDDIKKQGLFYQDQNGIVKSRCLEINKILDSAAEDMKPLIQVNVNQEIVTILKSSQEEFEQFLLKG
jgi:DNA-binding transcriptional regulator YhcF (GntR family)